MEKSWNYVLNFCGNPEDKSMLCKGKIVAYVYHSVETLHFCV